jgi:hypothetical protein
MLHNGVLIVQVIEGYGVADEGTAEFKSEFQALKPLFKKVFDNFDTKVRFILPLTAVSCLLALLSNSTPLRCVYLSIASDLQISPSRLLSCPPDAFLHCFILICPCFSYVPLYALHNNTILSNFIFLGD